MDKSKLKVSDKDFAKQISEWLTPKGFQIIFENHPNSEIREFHYWKDHGIRIVCINNAIKETSHENQCYLHKDLINERTALISWKFDIGNDEQLQKEWEHFKRVLDMLSAGSPVIM